jgi:predicted Zn-dependent protease
MRLKDLGPWPFAAAVMGLAAACATVPISGRKQVVLLPFEQEAQLGRDAFTEVLKEEQVSTDRRKDVVNRVSRRVIRNTPKKFRSMGWEHRLLAADSANAFAVPGGRIAIYEGILPVAKTEGGLAAVVGHEVAHVTSRHGAERITSELLLTGLLSVAAISLSDVQYGSTIVGALGLGTQLGVVLPFSRKHETEADYVGMIYMAKAGYDPHAAPRVWKRMAEQFGDTGFLTFLSTHPSSSKRRERLTEDLPTAMKRYRQAKRQYGLGERIDEARPGPPAPTEPEPEEPEPEGQGIENPRAPGRLPGG